MLLWVYSRRDDTRTTSNEVTYWVIMYTEQVWWCNTLNPTTTIDFSTKVLLTESVTKALLITKSATKSSFVDIATKAHVK